MRNQSGVIPVLLSKESNSSFVGGDSLEFVQLDNLSTVPILEVVGQDKRKRERNSLGTR